MLSRSVVNFKQRIAGTCNDCPLACICIINDTPCEQTDTKKYSFQHVTFILYAELPVLQKYLITISCFSNENNWSKGTDILYET